jgi:hypothetical protein
VCGVMGGVGGGASGLGRSRIDRKMYFAVSVPMRISPRSVSCFSKGRKELRGSRGGSRGGLKIQRGAPRRLTSPMEHGGLKGGGAAGCGGGSRGSELRRGCTCALAHISLGKARGALEQSCGR